MDRGGSWPLPAPSRTRLHSGSGPIPDPGEELSPNRSVPWPDARARSEAPPPLRRQPNEHHRGKPAAGPSSAAPSSSSSRSWSSQYLCSGEACASPNAVRSSMGKGPRRGPPSEPTVGRSCHQGQLHQSRPVSTGDAPFPIPRREVGSYPSRRPLRPGRPSQHLKEDDRDAGPRSLARPRDHEQSERGKRPGVRAMFPPLVALQPARVHPHLPMVRLSDEHRPKHPDSSLKPIDGGHGTRSVSSTWTAAYFREGCHASHTSSTRTRNGAR